LSTLNAAQVYTLAHNAGFDAATSAIMVGISSAESEGFQTDILGDVDLEDATWGPSVGLWQIRSLKAQTGTGGPRDVTRLTDPVFNAQSAYSIYKGQGLKAWTTYTDGAYKAGMSALGSANPGTGGRLGLGTSGVSAAVNAIPAAGAAAISSVTGAVSGLDAVGAFFGQLGQRATWIRILQVVGGAALIVGGVSIVGKGVIGDAASSLIPGGEAVKAVAGAVT
jgi:hypothetical protein